MYWCLVVCVMKWLLQKFNCNPMRGHKTCYLDHFSSILYFWLNKMVITIIVNVKLNLRSDRCTKRYNLNHSTDNNITAIIIRWLAVWRLMWQLNISVMKQKENLILRQRTKATGKQKNNGDKKQIKRVL